MGKKTFVEYQGLEYGALHLRGEVEDISNLPSSNNIVGDCYRVIKRNTTYVWEQIGDTTFTWKPISSPIKIENNIVYITDFNNNTYARDFEPVVAPANPTFSPSSTEAYEADGGVVVTISCDTPGAQIRYTTDGSDPSDTAGTVGTSITINQDDHNEYKTVLVKAIAVKLGQVSEVVSQTYKIRRKLSAPKIEIVGGTDEFDLSRQVKMTGSTGATIHYTTDNAVPTTSSASAASPATVTVGNTTTSASGTSYKVRAIQTLAGWADSEEGTAVTVTTSRTLTHIGWKDSSTIDVAGIESLPSDKRTQIAGTYTVPNSTIGTAYMYFCFPDGWNITSIKSSGFGVPITNHGTIGGWHVYSVDQTAVGGTFTIS